MNIRVNLILAAVFVLVAIVASGCATSARTEFIDADGTSFKAVAKAGPFGKLDVTNQHLAYRWNATDGTIEVGSEAQGLDNSGQIAAAQVTGQLVTSIVASLASAGLFTPKIDVVSPDTSPLDRLANLCELLCRVPAVIVDGSPMLSQSRHLCGCD